MVATCGRLVVTTTTVKASTMCMRNCSPHEGKKKYG
jgi:hypothetical protein